MLSSANSTLAWRILFLQRCSRTCMRS
jgi:hypothetical protein